MEQQGTNTGAERTAATKSGRAVLETALARGGKHVGDLVWWSLRDVKIPRSVLSAELYRLGFEKHVPSDPGAWSKLTRAATMAQAGKKGVLIRPLGREGTTQTVAIVRETVDATAKELRYGQTSRVSADRKANTLTLEHPGEAISEAVREAFDTITDHVLTDDLRPVIVGILTSLRAVSLRDGGGVFFVRAEHAEAVRALRTLVEAHGGSRVSVFRICEGDTDEIAQVTAGVRESVAGKCEAMIAQLAAWIRESKGRKDGHARRSLDAHVRELRDLDAEVDFYADMLGDIATDLRAKATEAREVLDSLMWDDDAPGADEAA